jgi:hypothetical protein
MPQSGLTKSVRFYLTTSQDPKPEDDGRVPNQDDFYLFFGIGFEL